MPSQGGGRGRLGGGWGACPEEVGPHGCRRWEEGSGRWSGGDDDAHGGAEAWAQVLCGEAGEGVEDVLEVVIAGRRGAGTWSGVDNGARGSGRAHGGYTEAWARVLWALRGKSCKGVERVLEAAILRGDEGHPEAHIVCTPLGLRLCDELRGAV